MRSSVAGCSAWPGAGEPGYGPMALLGCFPGEQHDLGLICFGLALRANGWRVTHLGPDTPFPAITEAARRGAAGVDRPDHVDPLDRGAVEKELAAISAHAPAALAGAGVKESDTPIGGATFLAGVGAHGRRGQAAGDRAEARRTCLSSRPVAAGQVLAPA